MTAPRPARPPAGPPRLPSRPSAPPAATGAEAAAGWHRSAPSCRGAPGTRGQKWTNSGGNINREVMSPPVEDPVEEIEPAAVGEREHPEEGDAQPEEMQRGLGDPDAGGGPPHPPASEKMPTTARAKLQSRAPRKASDRPRCSRAADRPAAARPNQLRTDPRVDACSAAQDFVAVDTSGFPVESPSARRRPGFRRCSPGDPTGNLLGRRCRCRSGSRGRRLPSPVHATRADMFMIPRQRSAATTAKLRRGAGNSPA